MCPVNDFSYHCLNRFFAVGLALAVVLLSLNKLQFNTVSLLLLFSNLDLALIHFFPMEREWSHVRFPLRIEVIILKSLLVWRQSSDTPPLNFRNLPKAFKAMQGAMGMSLALRAAYNLEKCALD